MVNLSQYFFCSFGIYIKIPLFWIKNEPHRSSISEVIDSKRYAYLNTNRAFFWKSFGSERINESQKLMKSAEKNFYPIFSSFRAKLSQKKLFLIESEILGLLDNTLTANYEYSRTNRANFQFPIQIKLSKKP